MKRLLGTILAATLMAAPALAEEQKPAAKPGTESAAPAAAAPAKTGTEIANNTAFGDWVVQCEAVTTSRNVCRIVQELTRVDSKDLVVRFIALPAADDTAILLAQVPIGVYLPGGAVYRLEGKDDEEQREMIWQRCLGDLCEAALSITADEMAKFTEAGGILFGYRPDIEAEPVIVRAEVARFGEAVGALRVAN